MKKKDNCSPAPLHLIFFAILSLAITIPAFCVAEGPTTAEYGTVLNLAGKQRMLSQKMTKEVLLINLNFKKDEI
jgi:hypothetical protein